MTTMTTMTTMSTMVSRAVAELRRLDEVEIAVDLEIDCDLCERTTRRAAVIRGVAFCARCVETHLGADL